MTSATVASGKTPSRVGYAIILALIGIGWGSTQPLGKIAASTGHPPFGLIFWQLVVCILVLGALTLARGKRLPRWLSKCNGLCRGSDVKRLTHLWGRRKRRIAALCSNHRTFGWSSKCHNAICNVT